MRQSNILIFLSFAWIIFALVFFEISDNSDFTERKVVFEGKIVEHPDVRATKTFLVLEQTSYERTEPPYGAGRVRVSTGNFTKYYYGEHLYIEGTLKEPENFSDFNWQGYLAKEGIKYVMTNPEIQKLGKVDQGLFYYAGIIRQKLQKGINNSLLPPHSSLYSAMLLANKSELTLEAKDNLAKTGLSHIVAISGMHIAVITLILFFSLLGIGLWRHKASYLALSILAFYIIMIGAPASAVRAGIMAAIVILAERVGRPNSAWRALLFAAILMVAFNPYILRYDIGFQLSFLAVVGILLLKKPIENWLWKIPRVFVPFHITKDRKVARNISENKIFGVRSLIALTLSAQIFTFPVILYNFGSISFVAPITNIFVLPILPLTLGAGFISALGGSIGGFASSIFAAPAWLFSSYIWLIISTFS